MTHYDTIPHLQYQRGRQVHYPTLRQDCYLSASRYTVLLVMGQSTMDLAEGRVWRPVWGRAGSYRSGGPYAGLPDSLSGSILFYRLVLFHFSVGILKDICGIADDPWPGGFNRVRLGDRSDPSFYASLMTRLYRSGPNRRERRRMACYVRR